MTDKQMSVRCTACGLVHRLPRTKDALAACSSCGGTLDHIAGYDRRRIWVDVNGYRLTPGQAERYQKLHERQEVGDIRDLAVKVPYHLSVSGQWVTTLEVDFVYTDRFGKQVLEEVDCVANPEWLIKLRLLKALHGLEVKVVAGKGSS